MINFIIKIHTIARLNSRFKVIVMLNLQEYFMRIIAIGIPKLDFKQLVNIAGDLKMVLG